MRTPFVAGNWKLNLDRTRAVDLASAIAEGAAGRRGVEIGVAPAFVHIEAVARALDGTGIKVGGQDCERPTPGRVHGRGLGADAARGRRRPFALVGHSERRHVFREPDALDGGKKLRGGAHAPPARRVLCIGETLDERRGNRDQHRR
jgi:triosephosphate isomerase